METLSIITAGFCTISIYSFLIKENQIFRFFEHIFIGIAAGLLPILSLRNFLYPNILAPLFDVDRVVFPDGTSPAPYNNYLLFYSIPLLFGTLYYFIYSKKYNWLAKVVIGFTLGASAGLAFKAFFNEVIPQIISSFKPLVVFDEARSINWFESINNCIFIFTLGAVFFYFFFSFKSESRGAHAVRVSGRYLMMICFGAFFGSTVMARMALLVERVQFLIDDWARVLIGLL
jgi:hypothetical protein